MNIHSFTFNLFQVRCRLIWSDPSQAIVVDPGFCDNADRELFYNYVAAKGLTVTAILLTHAHLDHIFGVYELQQRLGIPVYMNPEDECIFSISHRIGGKMGFPAFSTDWKTTPVKDGDILHIGDMEWEVIATPGHTPGSVCYLNRKEGLLLSGDTLFAGAIGRTDLEYGDYDKEIVSIMEKLVWLDAGIQVLPGHGADSTIGRERSSNPFLEPFNEREELECLTTDKLPHN